MAKEYYKKSDGTLNETSKPKIKVFPSIDAMYDAMDNGELATGELVTTEFLEDAVDLAGATNLLADQVALIREYIPDDAGVTNKLTTEETVDGKVEALSDEIKALLDIMEPIGTIKAVGIASGWDTEHWALCDGTNGTPDLREATLKGVGETSETVGAHNALGLLQFQDDRIQNITGEVTAWSNDGYLQGSGAFERTSNRNLSNSAGYDTSNRARYHATMSFDASKAARTGTTTEVKAVGVNYIMKIANYGD